MQTPKPGFLTSELWLGLASLVIPAVLTALEHAPNPYVSLAGIALAAAYGAVRTNLKQLHLTADQPAAFDPNVFGAMTAHEKAAATAAIMLPTPAAPATPAV